MTPLTLEDRARAREVLRALGAHPRVTTEDGTALDLPASVTEALAEILEAAADGERALVLRSTADLTTEQAAAILGVSRPTVARLVDAGKLPARMVGTHRRLALTDVIAYREASDRTRSGALDRMVHEAEDLGLYDD
jgi:excisionase family DNA binding protein